MKKQATGSGKAFFSKLGTSCNIQASRRGRSVFSFAGIRVREKGKEWTAPDAPEKLTLAVTAYSLTSNPLLRGKMEAGAYRRLGVTEREAVAACLKAGGR